MPKNVNKPRILQVRGIVTEGDRRSRASFENLEPDKSHGAKIGARIKLNEQPLGKYLQPCTTT